MHFWQVELRPAPDEVENVPAEQGVHAVALTSEYAPRGQTLQELTRPDPNVPAAQFVQTLDPGIAY